MGHRFDACVLTYPRHDLKRLLPRRTARAIRDRDEGRMQRAQFRNRSLKLRGGLVRFRRKKLKEIDGCPVARRSRISMI